MFVYTLKTTKFVGMNDLLERLKEFDNTALDTWFDLELEETEEILDEICEFAGSNKDELIQFCQGLEPKEDSALVIIYEALSEFPDKWGRFLLDEMKRLYTLANDGEMQPEALKILEDIECGEIAENTQLFNEYIGFVASQMSSKNEVIRYRALSLFDWFLCDVETGDEEVLTNLKGGMQQVVSMQKDEMLINRKKASEVLEEQTANKGGGFIDKSSEFYKSLFQGSN